MYRTILLRLDPVLHLSLTLLAETQGRSIEQLAIAVLTTYQEGDSVSCVPCQDEASNMAPLVPFPFDAATSVAPVLPRPRPIERRRQEKRKGPRRHR